MMQGPQKDKQVLQGGEEFCWGHVGAPKGGAHWQSESEAWSSVSDVDWW